MRVEGFGQGQAELGAEAGAVFPAARAARGQLDAHSQNRTHAQLLGIADDGFQLGEFLHDGNDLLAHLAGQHGHLDELVIFETVADDGRIQAVGQGQDGEQLGLGTGFQAEVERLAEIENLFDHVPLLVHLDGIDAAVIAAKVEFGNGGAKGLLDFAHPMPQNIGEAEQDGQLNAPFLKLIDQFLEVDGLGGVFIGVDGDMASLVDTEVALAPIAHAVGFQSVLDFPLVH